MAFEKFTFEGHDGSELAARTELTRGPVRAHALFAHCFTCGKDIAAARRIAQRLAAQGISVTSFDFTGLGHSEGEFANTGFTSNVADLVKAAERMTADGRPPQLLIGHSLGGAAVIAAAPRIASVRAVATIGAPHDPAHVLENFEADLRQISCEGSAEVTLAGRRFTIGQSFVEDVEAARLDEALGHMRKALLVLHAPRDEVVGIDNATAIFLAARHPKSFVTLDTADHLLTRREDGEYAASVIAAWAGRYLNMDAAEADGPPEGVVRVTEVDPEGFRQDVSADGHHVAADEPVSVGGTASGFTPYQFISAGLGACTSMTIRMYARRKGIALTHVAVDVEHDKLHAEDCADCEGKPAKIDRFTRRIRLEGDLSEAERKRLMEIADRCPVHRTLDGEIRIETVAS